MTHAIATLSAELERQQVLLDAATAARKWDLRDAAADAVHDCTRALDYISDEEPTPEQSQALKRCRDLSKSLACFALNNPSLLNHCGGLELTRFRALAAVCVANSPWSMQAASKELFRAFGSDNGGPLGEYLKVFFAAAHRLADTLDPDLTKS